MKAEIISIGTELLLGEIVNTDASFIAAELPSLGIELYHIVTVGDNKQRIIEALSQASQRSDIIITTGGLGPTQDDITRESVAEFLHEEITIDSALVSQFESFFAIRHLEMSPSNKKQAAVIPSAEVIPNKRGTAPGWWISHNGKYIVTLPGPTGELKDMWALGVVPKLQKLGSKSVIVSRTLKLFGLPESTIDDMIAHLLSSTNPTIGVYAKVDGIHLRITAKAETAVEGMALIQKVEKEIRSLLEVHIWGTDSDTLEAIVQRLLIAKNFSIGTMESETGGMLAAALTANPDFNKYFKGGYVTPSDEIKISLGVNAKIIKQYGKISPEIARAMATRARELTGAGIGMAITVEWENMVPGKIGTGHGSIGIDDGTEVFAFSYSYPGQPFQIKQRSVTAALFELRKIMGNGGKHASHN
jgi:nicotinamide-nucleotide amidase